MKGDVFNSCCGNATGDMFSATGDIMDSCTLNLPYDAARVQMLRDRLSIARNKVAQVTAERDQAKIDWANCKRKVFATCRGQSDRVDEKEAALKIAEQALRAATLDLEQAEKANAEETLRYNACMVQQTARQAEIAKQEAAKAELARIEAAKVNTDATVVPKPVTTETKGVASIITDAPGKIASAIKDSSSNMKYGLIAIVVVGLGVVGYYKFVKK